MYHVSHIVCDFYRIPGTGDSVVISQFLLVGLSVCPSVPLSVGPSVHRSVRPSLIFGTVPHIFGTMPKCLISFNIFIFLLFLATYSFLFFFFLKMILETLYIDTLYDFFVDKVVKLVGGGSVINGATTSSFLLHWGFSCNSLPCSAQCCKWQTLLLGWPSVTKGSQPPKNPDSMGTLSKILKLFFSSGHLSWLFLVIASIGHKGVGGYKVAP